MATYAADTWLTPVEITASNNTFVVIEDPSGTPNVLSVALEPGLYWPHADDALHVTCPGLYRAIAATLSGVSGHGTLTGTPTNGGWAFVAVTPTASSGLVGNGLQLRAALIPGSPIAFAVAFNHASFTMPPAWFGGTSGAVTSGVDGSSQAANMPRATRHRLITRDLADGSAIDKRAAPYMDIRRSSPRPAESTAIVWDQGKIRGMRYEHVPGVEVHATRAAETEWAATTGRAVGDVSAVWADVWEALQLGREIIVVHNAPSTDLQVLTHTYEIARAWEASTWERFADQSAAGGDLYTINALLWIAQGNYGH